MASLYGAAPYDCNKIWLFSLTKVLEGEKRREDGGQSSPPVKSDMVITLLQSRVNRLRYTCAQQIVVRRVENFSYTVLLSRSLTIYLHEPVDPLPPPSVSCRGGKKKKKRRFFFSFGKGPRFFFFFFPPAEWGTPHNFQSAQFRLLLLFPLVDHFLSDQLVQYDVRLGTSWVVFSHRPLLQQVFFNFTSARGLNVSSE